VASTPNFDATAHKLVCSRRLASDGGSCKTSLQQSALILVDGTNALAWPAKGQRVEKF